MGSLKVFKLISFFTDMALRVGAEARAYFVGCRMQLTANLFVLNRWSLSNEDSVMAFSGKRAVR